MIDNQKDWDIACNRFIGFIDIMGFKNLIETKSQSEIYAVMKMLHGIRETDIAGYMTKDGGATFTTERIRTVFFSDSLIFYTEDDSEICYHLLLNTMTAVTSGFYELGVPFKGAIAYGEFTADVTRSIYFGQPLVDAFLLQEDLALYAMILHDSMDEVMSRYRANSSVMDYDFPAKENKTFYRPGITLFKTRMMPQLYDNHRKKVKNMGVGVREHIQTYVKNTLAWMDFNYREYHMLRMKV
ncbi:MAG: hypothetical protein ACKVOK_10000 [Flavobacteriales bacterium]